MTVRKLIDFTELLPPNRRLLGLDIGEKTVGLALSDISRTVATPMETLTLKKFSKTAVQLLDICVEHEVAGLVIGLPVNMDGTEGPRCQSVRQFARNLEAHFDMEMAFWDERLSTVAVTKTMIEADMSRAKRAENVDKMAAGYILQGALDFLANHATNTDEPAPDSWG
jgi:putative Holliday junction resolvase